MFYTKSRGVCYAAIGNGNGRVNLGDDWSSGRGKKIVNYRGCGVWWDVVVWGLQLESSGLPWKFAIFLFMYSSLLRPCILGTKDIDPVPPLKKPTIW